MDNPTLPIKKRILVVEDDEFLRDFYHELLDSDGYLADVAADGDEGLAKIKQGGYDLVLLDIMLPKPVPPVVAVAT